ncbi:helix-turn-helix transcriptional regulator [Pararobbsia alpina]|uniref:AlpA family phage regulatory protein n=1 Tax=Pararobbsia alpina TaxID=621374 RepID=A0A6S7BN41_9BURK|nr:AlpA family phage regulatory protein [Pararobbsia alpina]CAB3806824.1 hypothetical protein LMG28138_05849 [Pararobbsia alpina]
MDELRIVELRDVIAITKIGRAKIFTMRKAGEFPAPAKLGGRAAVWWLADIQHWLAARRADDLAKRNAVDDSRMRQPDLNALAIACTEEK